MKQLFIALLLSFCCYTAQAKDLILKFNIDTIAINGSKTATQRLSEQSYADAMKSKENGVSECLLNLMLLQQNLKENRANLVKGYYVVKNVDTKVLDKAKALFNKNDFSLYLSEIDFYNKIVSDKKANDKVLSTNTLTIKSPNGQLNFVSPNKKDIYVIVDSLMAHTRYKYIFESEKNDDYDCVIGYVMKSEIKDRITIWYKVRLKNENKTLEIEGTPEYNLYQIIGRFVDIYPFWCKFINPDENMEDLTAKKVKYIKKEGRTYLIRKMDNSWCIDIKGY